MGNGLDHASIVHFDDIMMCDSVLCCVIVCLVNST